MPFTTSYDVAARLLLVCVNGQVGVELFAAAMKEITTSAEYPANVDTIWDFRAADFSATGPEGMRRLLAIRTGYTGRAGSRTAFVVGSDVAYGMARMFQLLADGNIPQDLSVHRTTDEALQWILEGRPNKAP